MREFQKKSGIAIDSYNGGYLGRELAELQAYKRSLRALQAIRREAADICKIIDRVDERIKELNASPETDDPPHGNDNG